MVFLLLIFVFGVYAATLLPDVGWGDVAKYQTEAIYFRVPLTAGNHPWYALVASIWERVIPWGQTAYKQNLLSACLAVGALLNLYRLLVKLEVKKQVACLGLILLAFSHTFWSMAVWAESYALFSWLWVLIIGQVLLFLKTHRQRELSWACFYLGLAMGVNLLQPFALPAIGITILIFVKDSRRLFWWWRPFLGGVLGILPWLVLILYTAITEHHSWQSVWDLALDSRFQSYLFFEYGLGDILKGMLPFPLMALYQFGFFLLFLKFIRSVERPLQVFLVLLILTIFIFCSTYLRQRALWLLLAAWIPLAYLLILCVNEYVKKKGFLPRWTALFLLLTVSGYAVTPRLLTHFERELVTIEPMATRDPHMYLTPWKHQERSARDFIDEVEVTLRPGDALIADFTPGSVLGYAQNVEGKFQDIEIHSLNERFAEIIESKIIQKDVYLARFNAAFEKRLDKDKWKVESVGSLYRMVLK